MRLFIDFSNFTTYSNKLSLAKYGNDKSEDTPKQINLLVAKGTKHQLPLFYEFYAGNISDSKIFQRSVDLNAQYLPTVQSVIFDQSSANKDNLQILNDKNIKVVTFMKKVAKEYKQLISNSFVNYHDRKVLLPNGAMYYSEHIIYAERDFQALAILSPEKYKIERDTILKEYAVEQEKLEKINRKHTLGMSEMQHSNVDIQSSTRIDLTLAPEKMTEKMNMAGWFALITDDLETRATEVYTINYMRESVERSLARINNTRMLVSNDLSFRGKSLCTFIYVILHEIIERTVSKLTAPINQYIPTNVHNFVQYINRCIKS
ncbi:transposase [Psittacicella hinzii]|uniref:Transposase IS4-like domain-containing protein n=1 Tax=Psittacicella hinzii TaxID=2028575 RepID=A0A3A1Y9X8_9GAMM|nr:transposase [Psittacicella hinzii]RIY34962.1 hypothetical protein CKF58_07330 [Psittacicella hinzii]